MDGEAEPAIGSVLLRRKRATIDGRRSMELTVVLRLPTDANFEERNIVYSDISRQMLDNLDTKVRDLREFDRDYLEEEREKERKRRLQKKSAYERENRRRDRERKRKRKLDEEFEELQAHLRAIEPSWKGGIATNEVESLDEVNARELQELQELKAHLKAKKRKKRSLDRRRRKCGIASDGESLDGKKSDLDYEVQAVGRAEVKEQTSRNHETFVQHMKKNSLMIIRNGSSQGNRSFAKRSKRP